MLNTHIKHQNKSLILEGGIMVSMDRQKPQELSLSATNTVIGTKLDLESANLLKSTDSKSSSNDTTKDFYFRLGDNPG